MSEPRDRLLPWVARWSAILGGAVIAGSLAFADLRVATGAVVGVAVALGNFWLLRRLAQRMTSGAQAGRTRAGALLGLKSLLLIGAIFLLMRLVPMHMLALLAGVSVVTVLIVVAPLLGPPLDEAASEDRGEGG